MILIKNGTLHTAVSKEPLQADILVDGGKIVKIGAGLSSEGAEVIDASGLNVYPGFVEPTATSDWTDTASAMKATTTTS